MDLYLIPDNPEHTILVSSNGVAHYQIRTVGKPKVSVLQRPADCEEESIVAEIEWRSWDSPTMIRSTLLGASDDAIGRYGDLGVLLTNFLFRKGRFGQYVPVSLLFIFRKIDRSDTALGTLSGMTTWNIDGSRKEEWGWWYVTCRNRYGLVC